MNLRERIIKWLGGHTCAEVGRLSYRIGELEAINREVDTEYRCVTGELKRAHDELRRVNDSWDEAENMIRRYRMIVAERADFRDVFPLPCPRLRVSADNEYRPDMQAKVYTLRLSFPEMLCMHMAISLDDIASMNTREYLYVWSERFANEVRDKAREIAIKALNALPDVPTGFFK